MKNNLERCSLCVLPQTFPGICFDEKGICNFCKESPGAEKLKGNRAFLKKQMEEVIHNARGKNTYDCIVAFSGGKDSSYTLMHLVKDYGLNCLAITIDNGFVSKKAQKNCYTVTDALGVDYIAFTPATKFMKNMYTQSALNKNIHVKSAITRASNMCNSCINLINNYMIKSALQNNVSMIAGGYIGGQVPKDAAILHLDTAIHQKHRKMGIKKYFNCFGEESQKYFGLDETLLQNSNTNKIIVLNPMLTLNISEEQIIKEIEKIGWQMTVDTGKNSSNCLLNDLGIAVHYKQYQFHPYIFEISEQIRSGLMTRQEALKKLDIPDFSTLTWQAEKIGLDIEKV